jgi:hypothetical protein
VAGGLCVDAFAKPPSDTLEMADEIFPLGDFAGGQRGRHRHAARPERAGGEDARGRVAQGIDTGHRGQCVTVGDRLAPGGQVGPDAQRLPAAGRMQAIAGTHLVEDQRRTGGIAELARAAREGRGGQLLVDAQVMFEGAGKNAGQVIASGRRRRVETGDVVVAVGREVSAILRRDAGRRGRAPRGGTVIRPLRHQDLAPAGGRARDRRAHRGRVGAVLLEHHPIGVRDARHQAFGQFDETRGGAVQAIAQCGLARCGGFDLGVVVAQQVGAPAAHEVDELTSVDIPQSAAAATLEELRVAGRQARGTQVAGHAARDDTGGTLAQRIIQAVGRTARGGVSGAQ